MIKLYIVTRPHIRTTQDNAIGYFLSLASAKTFMAECHRIAPQAHMRCDITESHVSTYGMAVEDSRLLVDVIARIVSPAPVERHAITENRGL